MPEIIIALFDYVRNDSISNIGIIILVVLSVVQISPIKFNPYDKFFDWLRDKLLGDFKERVDGIWINFVRQHILRFARECRQNIIHSLDEWQYVLNMVTEYEDYCENNNIANGIIEAETKYIRDLYLEHSKERKFV